MEFSNYIISVVGIFRRKVEIYLKEELQYIVKQESLFNTRRFIMRDINDVVLCEIYRTRFFSMNHFDIIQDHSVIGDIQRKVFANHYEFNSIHGYFSLEGNLLGTEYKLYNEDEDIGMVSKKIFKSRNQYGLVVQSEFDDVSICAFMATVAIANQLRKQSG